jgi:hypothetical protein
MGMFDTILINPKILPISEEDRNNLKEGSFQTKSLENALNVYRINENGFLETIFGESFFDEDETDTLQKSRDWEIVRLTDAIKFHTYINDEYFNFVALFEEGKLLIIKRVVDIRTAWNMK